MNTESQVLQINIDDIIPNRFQPRLAFDEQGLTELAASIKEHGIIQPLVLRRLGSKYEIIAGERRYKASQLAGLTTVPAIISKMDDNTSAEVALVENIQRRDLTPIEEARSYKNLLDKGYLTQESLAQKMGVSQSTIANKLRLLNLDDEVQSALLEGKISERHARALLVLNNHQDQKFWLNRIINERMTVRQLDQELKKVSPAASEALEDVPLVNANQDLEDIKRNAMDINAPTMNTQNNMVGEDVLTDYSETLDSVPFVGNKTFETLEDTPTPQPESLEDIMNTMPNSFNSLGPTPVVENKQSVSESLDTMNIPELNPSNKFFVPQQPVQETPVQVQEPIAKPAFDPMSMVTPSTNEDPTSAIINKITELQAAGNTIHYHEEAGFGTHRIIIEIENK